MRELSVQSSQETLSKEDRAQLQEQFDGLRGEVDRLPSAVAPDGQGLFGGSDAQLSVSTGESLEAQVEVELPALSASDLGLESSDLSSAQAASASLGELDAALDSVSEYRGQLGSTENRLTNSLDALTRTKVDLSRGHGELEDADLALETAVLAQQQLLRKGAASVLLQSNVAASRAQSLLGGYA